MGRSALRCWRWCWSARWSARTTPAEAASAYGTTFWWAAGITALAIVPCIVLARAERAARRERGSPDPGVTEEAVAESLA